MSLFRNHQEFILKIRIYTHILRYSLILVDYWSLDMVRSPVRFKSITIYVMLQNCQLLQILP